MVHFFRCMVATCIYKPQLTLIIVSIEWFVYYTSEGISINACCELDMGHYHVYMCPSKCRVYSLTNPLIGVHSSVHLMRPY